MASLITNIYEITRRPCYVDGQRAIFNCWSQEIRGVMGIVEFENGGVSKVYPENIQFADGGGFEEYAFRPMNE